MWIVLFLMVGHFGLAWAESEPFEKITAPEVKDMMDKGNAVLVHSLSAIEFEIQHIPGSINIPIIEMQTTTRLPEDKNKPLIFYCMGLR
jgi:rhodanese-related sulfurtransferase